MFAWTAADAATAAGEHDTAALIAHAVIDRAYTFWDAARHEEGRTLPGVACEYWPVSGRCGGEGYGWGAFTTHLLLGVVLGLRVSGDGVHVRPALPEAMRKAGARYSARLTLRGCPVVVTLRPVDDGVRIEINGKSATVAWGEESVADWEEVAAA